MHLVADINVEICAAKSCKLCTQYCPEANTIQYSEQLGKDKGLFSSKNFEEMNNVLRYLVELKGVNMRDPQEVQNFLNGLKASAKSRLLTEEARVFLTLPKGQKREEIERRR